MLTLDKTKNESILDIVFADLVRYTRTTDGLRLIGHEPMEIIVSVYLKPKALAWNNLMELLPEITDMLNGSSKQANEVTQGKYSLSLIFHIVTKKKEYSNLSDAAYLKERFFNHCVETFKSRPKVDVKAITFIYIDDVDIIHKYANKNTYHDYWIGMDAQEIANLKSRIRHPLKIT